MKEFIKMNTVPLKNKIALFCILFACTIGGLVFVITTTRFTQQDLMHEIQIENGSGVIVCKLNQENEIKFHGEMLRIYLNEIQLQLIKNSIKDGWGSVYFMRANGDVVLYFILLPVNFHTTESRNYVEIIVIDKDAMIMKLKEKGVEFQET